MNNIGFIGAGNMASSLIGGLIKSGFAPETLRASEPAGNIQDRTDRLGIQVTADNCELAQWADIIVLAVKPQVLQNVCKEISTTVAEKQPLLISIAAGIRIQSMMNWLAYDAAIVRVMPNTPALVSMGMSALYANRYVSEGDKAVAQKILQAVGQTLWLDDENKMDGVTAISGSGPAYFFLLMESLITAAGRQGLDEDTARQLVLQTALGTAEMAMHSEADPSELRRRVTSPGGTTESAIGVFQDNHFEDITVSAVSAAAKRSVELSEILGEDNS
ncbi:MAG: pyrroline-5-carboxylate reductase [Gammaproteobacteria bacterium]|nr:MAG: pyrroline-5-carboxylate reductase [Gammaproteobacteria bacterium]